MKKMTIICNQWSAMLFLFLFETQAGIFKIQITDLDLKAADDTWCLLAPPFPPPMLLKRIHSFLI